MLKDKKLSEFNYKVLHNILPCNVNLLKWKKKLSDICSICNTVEDIPHMLYHCVYAKKIWDKLNCGNDIYISDFDVIIGNDLSDIDIHILSFITYFIYKMWLKHSFNDESRDIDTVLHLLKVELTYIYKVYCTLQCHVLCEALQHVIDLL